MKTKLNRIFVLIAIALFGIIMFQIYWTFNAYQVNKTKFDSNINIAMQNAMDDCKKDYFDSVRRILVRRISPPETSITIDTLHEADTVHKQLFFHFSNQSIPFLEPPFNTTSSVFDFYRKKIPHKATIPEVLVEMSFYVPHLMNNFTMLMGMNDIMSHRQQLPGYHELPRTPKKTIEKQPAISHWRPEQPNDEKEKYKDSLLTLLRSKNGQSSNLNKFFLHHIDSMTKAQITRNKMEYQADTAAARHKKQIKTIKNARQDDGEASRRFTSSIPNSIYTLPPNYRKADSLRLYKYLFTELNKIGISSSFRLAIAMQATAPSKLNTHYSEN